MLGTATVMIGAQDALFDLNATDHSIGLVKNFTITSQPTYTNLTQGVKNQNVASVMTGNTVSATMEAYEYTSKNISYALGLEGSTLAPITTETTTSAVIAGTDVAPEDEVTVTSATGITAGSYIMIQVGNDDQVTIRKVSSVASNVLTVSPGIKQNIAVGARVSKVNVVDIGSLADQPYLSAKVVGTIANGKEITLLLPKIRVTAGFSLAFTSSDFGNMPIEFTLYNLVSTDPNYSEFQNAQAKLFSRA
ncbi:hypothetical protein P409_00345 [Inquilinus limosus MP06]|uniref:Uncharacterized protein n=2 Tax=Inquilinus limosus TaxID=171674 RepID=A0A0A0DDK9_9PROT|nr:hypothetical protein P409_00345 [Inquilinus limosus MP06]